MNSKVAVVLIGLALTLGFVVGKEHRQTVRRNGPSPQSMAVVGHVASDAERVSITVPVGTCLRSATLDVVTADGEDGIGLVPPDCWVIGFSDHDRNTRRVVLKPRPESFAKPSIP